jgi:hypothetical protein
MKFHRRRDRAEHNCQFRESKVTANKIGNGIGVVILDNGNTYLHRTLCHAEAKKLLVGLVTTSNSEVQEELTFSLRVLSTTSSDSWQSLKGREGVQLLISLLGLSTEQQQEYVVALLSILSMEVDSCWWNTSSCASVGNRLC